jgi:hypothetical protein
MRTCATRWRSIERRRSLKRPRRSRNSWRRKVKLNSSKGNYRKGTKRSSRRKTRIRKMLRLSRKLSLCHRNSRESENYP